MSNYSLNIEIDYEDFELPPLELPPASNNITIEHIVHNLKNKHRMNIKPYTIQDILRGKHNQDIIINVD